MFRIAVVEDDPAEAGQMESFLKRYYEERGQSVSVKVFDQASPFLGGYQGQYDLVFLDIELPDTNGMTAAHCLRDLDETVSLIFVTHLAQYAVRGYEVDAAGYLIKPVSYPALALTLQRVMKHYRNREESSVSLKTNEGKIRLPSREVGYVEVYKHHIVYHTEKGEYEAYGTLKEVEEALPKEEFYRISSSAIVNMRSVVRLSGQEVVMEDGHQILISRAKKKDFLAKLHVFSNLAGKGR